ncbi:MAG TPA: cytidylate kinase-like family protein [Gemmataceae bacterium]|nr:cytidylate kinase-like family protein [Gemmataceae bacterium]
MTISREAGTQGTAVAEEVGSRLQWQVYDHQLLELVAQDMGVRAKLLESIDEKRTTWLLEDFESALGVPMVTEPAYVHHLVRTVLALSSHGECVIVGRGAAQILSGPHTFRVRLVAPLQWRLQAVCREHGMKMDEAKAYLQDTDREHAAFVRELFQKDPAEAHQYDLIINRAHFGVAECAGLIVEGVRALQPRRS